MTHLVCINISACIHIKKCIYAYNMNHKQQIVVPYLSVYGNRWEVVGRSLSWIVCNEDYKQIIVETLFANARQPMRTFLTVDSEPQEFVKNQPTQYSQLGSQRPLYICFYTSIPLSLKYNLRGSSFNMCYTNLTGKLQFENTGNKHIKNISLCYPGAQHSRHRTTLKHDFVLGLSSLKKQHILY